MYDIHSPHTRGDRRGERWRLRRGISIHSCEGRQQQNAEGAVEQEFQSAPLMRGETVGDVEHAHRVAISIHSPHARGDTGVPDCRSRPAHFNPLPSYEGRRIRHPCKHPQNRISIHSPHARGDATRCSRASAPSNFNPLPSHEGRQYKPPKIHPDLRQLTQQNHDTPLFGALQAPFCGAEPDIRGAKPTEKP